MTKYPKMVQINFGTMCNYKCVFCNNPHMDSRYMKFKYLESIDELIQNAKIVDIASYGEVLLHPQINNIIEFLTGKNKPFCLLTNGSPLTEEMSEKLVNSSLNIIGVSINSIQEDTYKYLSGGVGDLKSVLKKVEYFNNIRNKIHMAISMVVNALNVTEMKQFIDYAKKIGVEEVRFYRLSPNICEYPDEIVMDYLVMKEYFEEVKEYALKEDVNINIFELNEQKRNIKIGTCTIPWDQFIINYDGTVVQPCCWLPFVDIASLENTPWKEIWNGTYYTDLRESILNKTFSLCKNCKGLI